MSLKEMPFNVNSGPQMQDFLYNFLGLKPLKEKNEKGNYSVAVDVLTHFAEKENIEFCKLLIDYRKLQKTYGTYVKGVEKFISEKDGCIHSDFWMSTTETGRSSSSDLNYQNIPKHGDIVDGLQYQLIRKIFSAEKRYNFWINNKNLIQPDELIGEVDYVGAEVKVCAALTDDNQLIQDLNNDMDQHSHWANVIFGLNKDYAEIKAHHKDERFLAKNNFTFANLFGAGAFSIAASFREHDFYKSFVRKAFEIARQAKGFNSTWEKFFVEYSESHIAECQNEFYKRYHDVKDWQDNIVKGYYDNGYVENPFGFRRRYPLKRNEIINFPIQSTSFHLLLHSLINIEKKMIELEMQSKLCGQVHDSGFFRVKVNEAEQLMELVKKEMEQKPFPWIKKVKLEAEWELGNNWYDIKLENKAFKAKHESGSTFDYNVMHWFSYDFGFDPDLVSKVLAGKKDKNDKPYKLDGWDLKYY